MSKTKKLKAPRRPTIRIERAMNKGRLRQKKTFKTGARVRQIIRKKMLGTSGASR